MKNWHFGYWNLRADASGIFQDTASYQHIIQTYIHQYGTWVLDGHGLCVICGINCLVEWIYFNGYALGFEGRILWYRNIYNNRETFASSRKLNDMHHRSNQ